MKLLLLPIKTVLRGFENKIGKHIVHQEIEKFQTDLRTLDIGCGQSPLGHLFPNRVGMDVKKAPGVHIVADAHCLPFASNSFQQIICSEVLEHLIYPQKAVGEMYRVLEEKGRLILTTPFVYPIHEAPNDYHRFTMYGLKELFSDSGFKVEQIKALYNEEQTLAILIQRIVYQRHNSLIRRYFYLILAQLMFRIPNSNAKRYQNISCSIVGPFMTAGYLLVANKE